MDVNDTTSKKLHTIQLTPSRSIDSIFKEISEKYDYNIHDINLVLESATGETGFTSFCVSKYTFYNLEFLSNLKHMESMCYSGL